MALTQVPIELSSTPGIVDNSNATAITIDSSENVKIGTATDRFSNLTASTANLQIGGGVVFEPGSGNNVEIFNYRTTNMLFGNGATEAMRIDASGNLLVGKTSTGDYVTGIEMQPAGAILSYRTGGVASIFGRTNDGEITRFTRNGSIVGNIGVKASNNMVLDGVVADHAGLEFGTHTIMPREAGADADATINLGGASRRFKDLYLSGDIAHLDAADNARLLYDKSSNLLGNAGTNGTFATLLVGTTSSINSTNTIQKSGSSTNALVINNSSSSIPYGLQMRLGAVDPNNTTSTFYEAYGYNGTAFVKRFEVRSNGGIANYQANDVNLSDERVKRDITPLSSMWDKFKALEIVTFKYKDQTHTNDNIGVIAQQVESVAPEFVSNDGFGETPEGEEPLKTIYTADLYHAAIKALQEAMTRIETLEAKVQQLETP